MSLLLIFGALALGAGIGMIFQRNPVHSALLLVVNLLAVAVLFLTLVAEFLFVAQIIIYAGAIVVLFLFVIMVLGVERTESLGEPRPFQARQALIGMVVVIVLIGSLFTTLLTARMTQPLGAAPEGFGGAESIGVLLFQRYVLPFQLSAVLLLVATIAILMLAKRRSD